MVHLTINGKPICLYPGAHRCQFSTRREAFDYMLRYLDGDVRIETGPCPRPFEPCKEGT